MIGMFRGFVDIYLDGGYKICMIDQAVVMITLGYIRLDVLHQIHRGTQCVQQ